MSSFACKQGRKTKWQQRRNTLLLMSSWPAGQCVQDVGHVGYSSPYITPEPLNSLEFSINKNDLIIILYSLFHFSLPNYIPSFNTNLHFKLQMTCLWLCTLLPAKVPCSWPCIIRHITPTFSPPWSACTLQKNETHFWLSPVMIIKLTIHTVSAVEVISVTLFKMSVVKCEKHQLSTSSIDKSCIKLYT